jgi:hypothetical protein
MNVILKGVVSTSGMQPGDTIDIALASPVAAELTEHRAEWAGHVSEYRFVAEPGATATYDGTTLTVEGVTPTSGFVSDMVVDIDAAGSQVVVTVHEHFDDSAPQVRELRFKTDGASDADVTLEAA